MEKKKNPKKILAKKPRKKNLSYFIKKKSGRGKNGRISVRHKGGGEKKIYRSVDFGQEKLDIPAQVAAIEYDPNRTSFICLLEYEDGIKRYRICPDGLKIGDKVICSEKAELKTGNRMKMKNIPVGTVVYNVEIDPGKGGQLVKSAGSSATVLAHEGKYAHLTMPSGEARKVLAEGFSSVGQVSFPGHKFIHLGKAGKSRHLGIRPTVRGSAMGPADHPHGGGEGRAPIGLKHPKTPWGKPALGVKTRKKKWTDKLIIKRRKKKKK